MKLIPFIMVVVATVIGAYGSLFFKKSNADVNVSMILNKYLWYGFFCYAASSALFILSLTMDNLAILYAITSLTYVWVSLLSMKHLKEKMNIFKWAGILFIILGVFLIAL